MSKITFRADDDLVERLESCDASKSEVMREALRTHLADEEPSDGVDAALVERVDEIIADRLDAALDGRPGTIHADAENAYTPPQAGDVTVNVTLDVPGAEASDARLTRETVDEDEAETRKTRSDAGMQTAENACAGCGENVPKDHVYCPNCGEKRSHRAFCECGDEIRTDWAFCPGCGRRTPAADVLRDT